MQSINGKRILKILTVLLTVFLLFVMFMSTAVFAAENVGGNSVENKSTEAAAANASESTGETDIARPSSDGTLQVIGSKLCNEAGEEVLLRGVSEHGITFFEKYVNNTLFASASEFMNANVIRLPMYTSEYADSQYCKDPMGLMKKGIDYAIANDMYVIVDWHVLENPDPNMDLYNAIEFFTEISKTYGDCPNIIYEICNEPNGDTTWQEICTYADIVIPIIRVNSPDSVILVGTPNYDREITAPADGALDHFDNIMYTFHFYAASHPLNEMKLISAVEMGLPVFVSECGFTEDTGDGPIDVASAKEWLAYLKEHNLSHTIWNLSDKNETSSMLSPGTDPGVPLNQNSLTVSGKLTRNWLLNDNPETIDSGLSLWESFRLKTGFKTFPVWLLFNIIAFILVALLGIVTELFKRKSKKHKSYSRLMQATGGYENIVKDDKRNRISQIILVISIMTSIIYLLWRILMSLPLNFGWIAMVCSVGLLLVEFVGFCESCIHYCGLLYLRDYQLPEIAADAYPDVDIFVSTYNEPEDLLRKTLIGCKNMDYPDRSKVHIYLCDDGKRSSMRALAAELGVNYLDRDTHEHAKAGNLNHALSVTTSPYIVTFDADMIPRKEFLMRTIPYFVDAQARNQSLPAERRMPLGFIQTPQCFYNPDVFQHNLNVEYKIPNEQDYFYRTIEKAKTESNSVIYGGSNTLLSREALLAIGGFYTESITEDFATGALIEAAGFISLGLSEPLASGVAPYTFPDHIKQRKRWGRGVINTVKKLKLLANKNLTSAQKAQYLTSVLYWYSPIKNFIYILSPFMYAIFGITVFVCNYKDLLIFWAPLFITQAINMYVTSRGTTLYHFCSVQEMSIMPFLFFDVIKETFGISMKQFQVTDKSKGAKQQRNTRYMLPFAVLIGLSVVAIARIGFLFTQNISSLVNTLQHATGLRLSDLDGLPIGLIILLFWIIRNLVNLITCLIIARGRESDEENVKVKAAYLVSVKSVTGNIWRAVNGGGSAVAKSEVVGSGGAVAEANAVGGGSALAVIDGNGCVSAAAGENAVAAPEEFPGITTLLTEHSLSVFLDEVDVLRLGESVIANVALDGGTYDLGCAIVNIRRSQNQNVPPVYTLEILDYAGRKDDYIYELYNRIPTLPQKFFAKK